jgi:hypothetical protein
MKRDISRIFGWRDSYILIRVCPDLFSLGYIWWPLAGYLSISTGRTVASNRLVINRVVL